MEEQGGGGAVALVADEGAVRVSGSYGTKLEAVVRRILHITRQDPTSKVSLLLLMSLLPLVHNCLVFLLRITRQDLTCKVSLSVATWCGFSASCTSPAGTPPPR